MQDRQRLVKQFLAQRDILLGYLLALTRDPEATEEIFQEVAVVIIEEANKGTEVDPFLGWAREVARRRALEYFRRVQRDRRLLPFDERWSDAVDRAFFENAWTEEELHLRERLLQECLGKLRGRARQVLELRYRAEHSIEQIATALAWQVNSVQVALSRARKALGDCIRSKLNQGDLEST
ncbi:MAG: sigma-70 family RNA polymerase sigma factor [Planctomycetota bacterium]